MNTKKEQLARDLGIGTARTGQSGLELSTAKLSLALDRLERELARPNAALIRAIVGAVASTKRAA